MKVKDLLKEINKYKKSIGKDFLEYDVYTEQLNEKDKNFKRKWLKNRKDIHCHHKDNGQGWEFIKDSEDWEYFKCYGYNTVFKKQKIFTINVNF